MNKTEITIRRALISVSDKEKLLPFAEFLHTQGVEIISTGGTARMLKEAGLPVIPIQDITEFPEMMDGRVKTLHPKIHGGILGLRDTHAEAAKEQGIQWIDLVVCNLYPFEETIKKEDSSYDTALENIDIGGPSMIRSAAKNVGWVTVIVNSDDYSSVMEEMKSSGSIGFETRKRLSAAAFRHTAQYDSLIQSYFTDEQFPEELNLTYRRFSKLRYGENPHQQAAAYSAVLPPDQEDSMSILNAEILNGKQLSYNNLNDADGALNALREYTEAACVVVKHANPCGAAVGKDITETTIRAFNADSLSAFGGIVAINRTCTKEIAEFFRKIFFEILIAPDYSPEALELLQKKKNLRVLAVGEIKALTPLIRPKFISGGLLLQQRDTSLITRDQLECVTQSKPSEREIEDMLFSWKVLKHVKSNGILTAKDGTTLGIGPGQVSRVDAVKIAMRKTADPEGTVLASDAFFPFRDSIDAIADSGIRAIIQPGGSIRDKDVIQACDEHGIAMVFTGSRCFNHG